jgi:hypothetical protein
MAKVTVIQDKPVVPPKKYILEMSEEEYQEVQSVLHCYGVGPAEKVWRALVEVDLTTQNYATPVR